MLDKQKNVQVLLYYVFSPCMLTALPFGLLRLSLFEVDLNTILHLMYAYVYMIAIVHWLEH